MGRAVVCERYLAVVGPLIEVHRQRLGISRAKMATLLGYVNTPGKGSYYYNVEKGDGEFHITTLFRAAEVLGPEFADDVAMLLFEATRRGMEERRDELLREAGEVSRRARDLRPPQRPKDLVET